MADVMDGGITPVFNEVSILLAICPSRPAPDATLEDVQKYAVAERCLMKAPIDPHTRHVKPTIFHRSATFDDPSTGLKTQLLTLAVDAPTTVSRIFGGELGMNVLPPKRLRDLGIAGFTGEAVDAAPAGLYAHAALPASPSVGRIAALQPDKFFPARVSIPVHYAFVSGGPDGKLETTADNFSIEAKEPHSMEAVVTSIPPDPHTPVCAKEWNLVDESTYLKLWIKVEAFRFLALATENRTERLTYRDGKVVVDR